MDETTVTFDRVFDIHRHVRDKFGWKFTTFGFESNGKRHFDVTIQGWPSLTDGMTITALLRKRGEWKTLLGWVNHASGELVFRNTARHFLWAAWLFLVALIAAPLIPVSTRGIDAILPTWVGYALCLVLAGFGLHEAISGISSLRERRAIKQIATSLGARNASPFQSAEP